MAENKQTNKVFIGGLSWEVRHDAHARLAPARHPCAGPCEAWSHCAFPLPGLDECTISLG